MSPQGRERHPAPADADEAEAPPGLAERHEPRRPDFDEVECGLMTRFGAGGGAAGPRGTAGFAAPGAGCRFGEKSGMSGLRPLRFMIVSPLSRTKICDPTMSLRKGPSEHVADDAEHCLENARRCLGQAAEEATRQLWGLRQRLP
jgi:hypothetical protein